MMILKIEITKACDQSCLHCPYSTRFNQNQKHLTLDELEKNITTLKLEQRLPSKFQVLITGGEPLLNPELFQMIDYLRGQGANFISLASNGLPLINQLALQQQLNKIDELIISLSSSAAEYLKLRNADMMPLLTTLSKIKTLYPKLILTGNYLAHSQNLDSLTHLAIYLDKLPFHQVRFLTYESTLAPKSSPLTNLTKAQLIQLTDLVRRVNRQLIDPWNLVKRLLGLPGAKKIKLILVPFERSGLYENSDDVYLSVA